MSAYKNSPYFEHYADSIKPIFQRKYELLVEMNLEILQTLIKILKISADIRKLIIMKHRLITIGGTVFILKGSMRKMMIVLNRSNIIRFSPINMALFQTYQYLTPFFAKDRQRLI